MAGSGEAIQGRNFVAGISMSRRTLALVVAIVLAAAAAIALYSYVTGEKNKAVGQGKAVQVFVAKEDIAAGTSADDINAKGLIGTAIVSQSTVAAGTIGSLQDIAGKVTAVQIYKGEQILAQRFVAPGQTVTGGSLITIPKGFQAMSVEVATIPGVANFVQAGDTVSIILQITQPNRPTPFVHYLLQNVKVLQVGTRVIVPATADQPATSSVQETAGKVDLTLAVTPKDAERLALGTLQGTLYFTLVPPGQGPASARVIPGRDTRNEFAR
jgi:pilus assembly protein CpaB